MKLNQPLIINKLPDNRSNNYQKNENFNKTNTMSSALNNIDVYKLN